MLYSTIAAVSSGYPEEVQRFPYNDTPVIKIFFYLDILNVKGFKCKPLHY